MPLATTTVNGTITLPDGGGISIAILTFAMVRIQTVSPYVLPTANKTVQIEASGDFTVELAPNDPAQAPTYLVTLTVYNSSGAQVHFERLGYIAVPSLGPVELADLIVLDPPESTQADALAQALAAAAAAAGQAVLAQGYADAAGVSASAAANSATDAADSAAAAASYTTPYLDDVAAVLADTSIAYGAGAGEVAAGDYIRTRAEGFSYEVAASGAADHDISTAGGVKLYVRLGSLLAFGAIGDGVTDDSAAVASSIAAGSVRDGDGLTFAVSAAPDLSMFTNARFSVGGVIYLTRDLDNGIDDASLVAPAFAPTSGASVVRQIISGDDGYHRHFGSMARDERGNLHIVYRRALGHTTYYQGAICHRVLDADGAVVQPETVLVPIQTNWDHEAPQIFLTPEGLLTLVYGSVGLPAGPAMPTNFYAMHKHVDADAWSAPSLIGTVTSGRNYGRIKLVPSIDSGRRWRLVKPYYGRNALDQRLLGTMISDDGGRSWAFGPNVYEGTTYENTEFDIAFVNALYGYAAMRRNSGRLHWLTTTDGGLTWSPPVGATWGTTSDVAPSLDVVYADGVAHLLLGYCDRASDVSAWRWAPVHTVAANPEAFGRTYIETSTGMLNASGYQCPVIYPSGQMAVVEFVERAYGAGGISDPVATDVRLVWASPANWISGRPMEKTLSMRGATTAGSPTFAASPSWYNKQPNGLVTVNFRIAMSSIGGMVGHLHITGLPYPIKNTPHARPGLSIGFIGGSSLSAGQIGVLGFGVAGGTEIALYAQTLTGTVSFSNSMITDSFTLYGTLTYFTDE